MGELEGHVGPGTGNISDPRDNINAQNLDKVEAAEPSSKSARADAPKRKNGLGQRPECFHSTVQEVLFVFMATIALATNTFLVGSTATVTASIGRDLSMSQSQISWIGAAST